MGIGALKSNSNRVAPPVTAQISVQPAPLASNGNQPGSSLENSLKANNSFPTSERNSSDSELRRSREVQHSRPGSQYSRRGSQNSNHRGTSGYKRRMGSGKRFTQGGTHSRPISSISKRNITSATRFGIRGGERLMSPTTGLPLQRELDHTDLGASMRTQRGYATTTALSDSEIGTVIFLRSDPARAKENPATCCQFCGNQFTTLGIRVPLMLLCGHSYCSNCLEKACENYPSALKCGICSILTPLDQQTTEALPQNEAILDLLASKEYKAMSSDRNIEMCAECEREPASMYCSECSASYCNFCGKKAHEGSRVRAKHKPVPINLKPRPQPTCRKHPGQSCVLYCETEKQPMCVLCKFYGQHRFHRYELLSKVAAKYCGSVSEKLSQLERMEKDLDTMAMNLSQSVEEIDSSARKAQEKLERHFADLKKSYLTALERREAVLLALVDRQVEIKQEMLEEKRMDIAAARARVLATREEASKLLQLNPVSALLARKHMDASFDLVLKETTLTAQPANQPEVPLSLLPDITTGMVQTLEQHGAVLQLPPQPWFISVSVTISNIAIQWEVPARDQNSDVTSDRTLTFSLHCYADVPSKLKAKLNFKKRVMGKLVTPESGFEDMSEYSAASAEPRANFPSLPTSLLGSRGISLVTMGSTEKQDDTTNETVTSNLKPTSQLVPEGKPVDLVFDRKQNPHSLPPNYKGDMETVEDVSSEDITQEQTTSTSNTSTIRDTRVPTSKQHDRDPSARVQSTDGLVLKPTGTKNITALLPEPIRLPKLTDGGESKLPQLVKQAGPIQRGGASLRPGTQTGKTPGPPNPVLNLPPLILAQRDKEKESETELISMSATSELFGDSEDPRSAITPSNPYKGSVAPRNGGRAPGTMDHSDSSLSLDSELSSEPTEDQFTNVTRFCKGFAFEEIYCGDKTSFRYSGLVTGATYYFRVRCHNAAGWGPWSDTVKCTTVSVKSKSKN